MDDYLELLILAYFREVGEEYSLYELKEIIGVSIKQIEEMVDALLDEKLLMYQNYLLTLSIKGRINLLILKWKIIVLKVITILS